MASSAPMIAEAERTEADDVVDQKAQELVDLITKSKHFIAFTGAGVSTSAGIADFRGTDGVWTLRAQGRDGDIKSANALQAIPTATHMALVELQNRGILKYLVSQNCDGLHRKSGMLPDRISELHGNSNREYCKDCNQEYIRDFRAVSTYEKSIHDHRTGRKCALCGGVLLDTIINFYEQLPVVPLKRARQHAKKADLCLALGSSLTIPPACTIPETVGDSRKATLVICNLQSTPLDDKAGLKIFAKSDDLMERVMQKLGLPIPAFVLHRKLVVEVAVKGAKGDRHELVVSGVDVDGTPATFLKSVRLVARRRGVDSEPFAIPLLGTLEAMDPLRVSLEFMGHYGEPALELDVDPVIGKTVHPLEYSPHTGEWGHKREPALWEPSVS